MAGGPRTGRDLLECASPAVLGAASDPLESKSWLAAVTVARDRIDAGGGGDPPFGDGATSLPRSAPSPVTRWS
jgi:hypothetical protein